MDGGNGFAGNKGIHKVSWIGLTIRSAMRGPKISILSLPFDHPERIDHVKMILINSKFPYRFGR